ncbi:protein FRIGIDA [Triticum aestivum]|nr:protein FRIGIDA-like [Triticum aestivum]
MLPPPPPPPAVPATSAAAAYASLAAIASSVEGLASFNEVLVEFLDEWREFHLDANSIAAALPPLADDDADPDPKPSPVGQLGALLSQWNPVLPAAAASPLAADRVAEGSNPRLPDRGAERREHSPVPQDPLHQRDESIPKPDPVVERRERNPLPAPQPHTSAAAAAAGFPVADPVPEPEPKPVLPAEVGPVRAPKPAPKPAPGRERRASEQEAEMLGGICEQMGSRSLRGFVTTHLRDRAWLRRVGPAALRRAPDPAVLVIRAVSRSYICAESENAETACVLLLELYVRAGCPRRPEGEGEAEVRAEARVSALSWRSRIVREKGRVADASARDARGLILLMAAFGVPLEFPLQELYQLLLAGGCLTCVDVLRCSQPFMKKLRDVVADMLNRGSYREAIGVILAFDLQEAFPLDGVLSYIVDKVVRNRKEQESEVECDLAGSKKRDEEELLLWRSISKYVEERTPCFSEMSCPSLAERIKVLEERVGKPNQTFLSEESREPSFSERREPNQAFLMI